MRGDSYRHIRMYETTFLILLKKVLTDNKMAAKSL